MSRLTHPSQYALSETAALRERRNSLLHEANRRRFRLHQCPNLTNELQQATTDLLRLELEARRKPEPLGDAGAVGDAAETFDFYKD